MSYQDPNQQSYGQPPQQPGQSWGQQAPQGSWGQDPNQQQQAQSQAQSWGQSGQQVPQQPYGSAPGYQQQPQYASQGVPQGAPGQSYGQQGPVDQSYGGQSYGNQSYGAPGYGTPQPGYYPQSDFGPGGYGPPQGNSTLATVALWLGIFGGWGLINLVISIMGISETGPGKKAGRNKAVTGLCLTIAWSVLWMGVFFAVSSHSNSVGSTNAAAVSSSGAAGDLGGIPGVGPTGGANPTTGQGGGVLPTLPGASMSVSSSDPGCQAAQAAYSAYAQQVASNPDQAAQTLAGALISAGDESQVASSQLKTLGQDFQSMGTGTVPSNFTQDVTAASEACGATFNVG